MLEGDPRMRVGNLRTPNKHHGDRIAQADRKLNREDDHVRTPAKRIRFDSTNVANELRARGQGFFSKHNVMQQK